MKVIEREQQGRRQKILQTAFSTFCRQGIDQSNLKEIARLSGVGEMTLYRYFGTKSALVLEALSVYWQQIGKQACLTILSTPNYQKLSGLDQIQVHMRCMRELYHSNADFVRFSYESKIYLSRNHVHVQLDEFDRINADTRNTCIAALDKGKLDGSIPSNVPSTDLYYGLWGCLRGYLNKVVIYDPIFEEEENPWESHYNLVETGVLSALSHGLTIV